MAGSSRSDFDRASEEALNLLEGLGSAELDHFAIVGNYTRFDPKTRSALKDFRQKVTASFDAKGTEPRNFLIWGAPGSGKSYLVQQVAASLPTSVSYRELNLAQLDEHGLRSGLEAAVSSPGPVLCLIDEVDSKPSATWPYELMLPFLEPSNPRPHHVCFCMAGSGGSSIDELKERIRSRPKGPDLVSRVAAGNDVTVPSLGVGDRMLVCISQLLAAAAAEGREVREIEKFALYYVAVNPALTSARQLRSVAAQSAQRIPPGDDRLRYDNLFAPGDPENKRFWARASAVGDRLTNSFVQVSPGRIAATPPGPTVGTAPSAPAASHLRLAVLPLANISPDPKDEYFADGLTDELITQVSRIASLRVIARTSVLQYKGSTKSLKDVAQELGVKLALEGSVRKAGNQLRITVQLVDTASQEPVWSSRYDRPLTDIFTIQDDIADHIAKSVAAHLSGSSSEVRPPTVSAAMAETSDMDAYSLYLHGRQLFGEKGSIEAIRTALTLFESAVARDPSFARARVGVGETLLWLATEGATDFRDAESRALRELQQALATNDGIAEAHSALAAFYLGSDRYAECEQEARRAMELNPSLADPYRWLAQLSAGRGELGESIRLLDAARQLNPDDINVLSFYGRALAYAGREAEALAFWDSTKSKIRFRTNAHMSEYYLGKRDLARAEESVRELERVRPNSPWTYVYRGHLAVLRGDPATARQLIEKLEERQKHGEMVVFFIGFLHYALGEMDEFVAQMDEARRQHVLPLLELLYSPLYAAGRADPRLQEILQRQQEFQSAPPAQSPS